MNMSELVKLSPLMARSRGASRIAIAVIDGPVAMDHPDLADSTIREVPGANGSCAAADNIACQHGTFVAGILCGKRDSLAPAICPGCTILLRPIFRETAPKTDSMPSAEPRELAAALIECMNAGAKVINLSLGLVPSAGKGEQELNEALNQAARRGILVVAAAGNHDTLGSTTLTRHPWVIPVAGCDRLGRPASGSNLGASIGRFGIMAPSENVTSLNSAGGSIALHGTSTATPFVSGAAALLWSLASEVTASAVRLAIANGFPRRRKSVTPPLLNAWQAYRFLSG